MSAKLNRPPIVGAWIGLQFAPDETTVAWGDRSALTFLALHRKDFPKHDIEVLDRVTVKESTESGLTLDTAERYITSLKMLNESEDRALEISENRVIYHVIAPGKIYPGFKRILEEATGHFCKYQEFFKPREIIEAAICYEDLIRIPRSSTEPLKLTDYFVLGLETPREPFGLVGDIDLTMRFLPAGDPGVLEYRFSVDRGVPTSSHAAFRQVWLKVIKEVGKTKISDVGDRLLTAQRLLHQCFQASFTEAGWNLFEPENTIEA